VPAVVWARLADEHKRPIRERAWRVGERLALIGCLMVPVSDTEPTFSFTEVEVAQLARLDHERWVADQFAQEAVEGLGPADSTSRLRVGWAELGEADRHRYVEEVLRIPAILSGAGYQIVRPSLDPGPAQDDFSGEEWSTLLRSLMTAGVLVAMAEGEVDPDEILALIAKLRGAAVRHPRRFIRELAQASTFETGIQSSTRYAQYEPFALSTIRSASQIVAQKAAGELTEFREFLWEIAVAVADANREGGFLGFGGVYRTNLELAAMEAISRACGRTT
jgi:hypothetical protein